MFIRLVHSQNTDGALLVTDIESGLPNEEFGIYRKQPGVYVPYYRSFFGSDGLVEIDRDNPGFIDLVQSDKVRLSVAQGVIAALATEEFFAVIEIPTGALNAPTISTVTQTTTGDVTVSGTNFESFSPDVTGVAIAGVALDAGDFSVDSATTITITTGTAYSSGEEVVVTANRKDSNAVSVDHTA